MTGSGAFAELLAHPGVEEVCALRSTFGLMAFHGGNLEQGTDQIAGAVAERTGASLYAVLQPDDLRWHVPSALVRPEASAALASFLGHVDAVIAVHGYGRDGYWTTLLLGGRNRDLAAHVGTHLRAAVEPQGFDVIDDIEAVPVELRGLHSRNPVNVPRRGGVQLELPPRIRGTAPTSRPEYTAALVDGLVGAVSEWAG